MSSHSYIEKVGSLKVPKYHIKIWMLLWLGAKFDRPQRNTHELCKYNSHNGVILYVPMTVTNLTKTLCKLSSQWSSNLKATYIAKSYLSFKEVWLYFSKLTPKRLGWWPRSYQRLHYKVRFQGLIWSWLSLKESYRGYILAYIILIVGSNNIVITKSILETFVFMV